MPVVKSDKPYARMVSQDVNGFGAGINTFLVDKQKYQKFEIALGSIVSNIQRNAEPVGIFALQELQIVRTSSRAIATIQPDLVVQLMATTLRVGALTVGADYHILVKDVRFNNMKDAKVLRFLNKYKFAAVASILHHYGRLTTPFVNQYAKKYDEEYVTSSKYGTKIYLKGNVDAPKAFIIPFMYKFGCRFINE